MGITRGEVSGGLDDGRILQIAQLLCHQGPSTVPEHLALPPGGNLLQLCLMLLCNIKGISRTFIKLIHLLRKPVHRIFRKDRRCTVTGGLVAHNQFALINKDGHLLQGLLQGQRPFNNHRLIFIFPVDLGIEACPFCTNSGFCTQYFFPQVYNTFCYL